MQKVALPERRLSDELRRAKSLRYPSKPPLLTPKTRQVTLTSSQSFDADVLAAIFSAEDDAGGNLVILSLFMMMIVFFLY